jgi:hypothetical protein
MMHLEKTFFDLADSCLTNAIVICDRGVMDATACELYVLISVMMFKIEHFRVMRYNMVMQNREIIILKALWCVICRHDTGAMAAHEGSV